LELGIRNFRLRREVPVSVSKKLVLVASSAFLFAAGALAQTWGAGMTIGVVNDVENHFHWDEFKSKDVAGYVEYEVEPKVIFRGTYGEMRVNGENAGKTFTLSSGETVVMPDLTNDIKYGTLGVSYEFFEGTFTSGLFGGLGGYKIEPREVPEEIANYRDNRETAFGLHVGADAGFQMIRHLSLVMRLTFHRIFSTQGRSTLSANAGLTYRF
jgi:outer membrane protein with beta-barrel domain